ncbi:MAG: hypothetical protein M3144_12360 [Actinomycetota bacterium]|nr:hypothetical protein [Actinomycetota bacterium]
MAAVKKAIAAAAPKNLDEADKFASSSKPDEIKAAVASKVTQGKQESGKDVAEKTKQPPDPSVAKEKPVVPMKEEPPPKPKPVDGAKAMPDKAPKDQTDFRAGPCEVDAQMKEAEVKEEHLEKSNEPQMQDAAKAKKEAEAHAAEAPGAIREKEAAAQKESQAGAAADAKGGMTGMVGTKASLAGKVESQKSAAKVKEEADRARISREINAIFDSTKTETEAILNGLDDKVSKAFDAGEAEAKAAFTNKHKTDMERYKDERYSGALGWARWTEDLFTGLPAEANQIFERAKVVYETKMSEVISNIADLIGSELDRAKARIEKGRQEIKEYVAKQPKELQKLAGETAQEVGEKFNQLESDVDAKQESLVNDLAQKYVEARNKVDEEIKAEQEKNKGLVDKVKDAVGGAIEAILKLKDLFMSVLAKAANAFTKILADPIAFIGNFMTALKNGFMNFANNIWDHLKKGLMGWLLGALASAGIEIPDSFDLKGILKLVASILGLTWNSIKARIMKIAPWVGKAIDFIESKIEVFVILATKGVVGIWEWIKDKIGDLTEMVLGPIKEFVVEKIVKAGITWVLGMLNPAGALIKIVQALIGVVQWVMERGAALADFVSTVIDSVHDIAHGGLGGVPAKIEAALGKAVPLVISFLANLLGLGGISEKIKSILETVQKPVGKAVDAVIKGALKVAKPLIAGLKSIGQKVKAKLLGGDDSPEGKKKRLDEGMRAAVGATNRFAGKPVAAKLLKPVLGAVKLRYRLTGLELGPHGDRWAVHGQVNPEATEATDVKKSELDPAKVKAAIATAQGELAKAQAEHAKFEASLRARGTPSANEEANRITVASGGGQIRRQGGGSMDEATKSIDAAWRHKEAQDVKEKTLAEAQKEAFLHDPTLTPETLGQILKTGKIRTEARERLAGQGVYVPKGSYQDVPREGGPSKASAKKSTEGAWKYEEAKEAKAAAIAEAQKQAWLSDPSMTPEKLGKVGEGPKAWHHGSLGGTAAVHAEKLVHAAAGSAPIGVSRAMCGDCQQFFKSAAASADFLVVADPSTVRIFLPDGSIKGPGDFK